MNLNLGHTIQSAIEDIKRKKLSPRDLFNYYADNIKSESLNAFLSKFEFNEPLDGPLSGIPVAIKDNILIDGTVCTAGSKILENYTSAYDATVIKKLRNAGAIFTGKTNLDEFAMGSSTENSAFGTTRNPLDISRVPGGSSGGSTAAIAADLSVFALGSDTGGSIRQPASFCGVVGLKPTYGRVSRYGLIAMSSSLDQIGPITKNVSDAALVLNLISGYDPHDSTTVKIDVPDFTKNLDQSIKGLRVGVPKEFFGQGLDQEVADKIKNGIKKLEDLGCKISEISLPHSKYSVAVYYIIAPSEISSNLARFDGIRYGYSNPSGQTLLETYINSREDGLGAEPKRRILLGTHALSSGYYDAYYLKAQKVRTLIKKDFEKVFDSGVDVVVGPTSPTTAFKIGEKSADPLSMYLSDVYTVPINLAGLPGISIPCGLGEESKMPVGFQIIGRAFDEETVLRVAYQLEKAL
jgi:aspartyl-tRNA(Asn)/glutamyl-tRNA(Gln) amidotransferase subunit A